MPGSWRCSLAVAIPGTCKQRPVSSGGRAARPTSARRAVLAPGRNIQLVPVKRRHPRRAGHPNTTGRLTPATEDRLEPSLQTTASSSTTRSARSAVHSTPHRQPPAGGPDLPSPPALLHPRTAEAARTTSRSAPRRGERCRPPAAGRPGAERHTQPAASRQVQRARRRAEQDPAPRRLPPGLAVVPVDGYGLETERERSLPIYRAEQGRDHHRSGAPPQTHNLDAGAECRAPGNLPVPAERTDPGYRRQRPLPHQRADYPARSTQPRFLHSGPEPFRGFGV